MVRNRPYALILRFGPATDCRAAKSAMATVMPWHPHRPDREAPRQMALVAVTTSTTALGRRTATAALPTTTAALPRLTAALAVRRSLVSASIRAMSAPMASAVRTGRRVLVPLTATAAPPAAIAVAMQLTAVPAVSQPSATAQTLEISQLMAHAVRMERLALARLLETAALLAATAATTQPTAVPAVS